MTITAVRNDDSGYIHTGDKLYTWCSKCGHQTEHVYQPGKASPLECQECKADAVQK